MKRFYLERTKDKSGVSGVGKVAEGVELSDGRCVLHWLVPDGYDNAIGIYRSRARLEQIHGHKGSTRIVWEDSDHGFNNPPRVVTPRARAEGDRA